MLRGLLQEANILPHANQAMFCFHLTYHLMAFLCLHKSYFDFTEHTIMSLVGFFFVHLPSTILKQWYTHFDFRINLPVRDFVLGSLGYGFFLEINSVVDQILLETYYDSQFKQWEVVSSHLVTGPCDSDSTTSNIVKN